MHAGVTHAMAGNSLGGCSDKFSHKLCSFDGYLKAQRSERAMMIRDHRNLASYLVACDMGHNTAVASEEALTVSGRVYPRPELLDGCLPGAEIMGGTALAH